MCIGQAGHGMSYLPPPACRSRGIKLQTPLNILRGSQTQFTSKRAEHSLTLVANKRVTIATKDLQLQEKPSVSQRSQGVSVIHKWHFL